MEFTNVMPYSEDNTDTLSGGIRQRVFFSMILAQDSRIIIMDEPVTYLDLEGKRTFFSMVNKLKKSGKTIILVLHDLSDAIRISDNLVIMNDRKIAISDTPAHLNYSREFQREEQYNNTTIINGYDRYIFEY